MLSIQALEPFLILQNALNGDEYGFQSLEPEIIGLQQGQKVANAASCPLGRGLRDDVRTYKDKAFRAAVLIYAHFQKEFLSQFKR
jgi:hypothetical protein